MDKSEFSKQKETQKKSQHISRNFIWCPTFFFFSECSFSNFFNDLLPLRIKFSADNLEVCYSFCFHIDPVSSAGKALPKPFVKFEEGEEHAYSGLLFHCVKIIFKPSLIFPRPCQYTSLWNWKPNKQELMDMQPVKFHLPVW